MTIIGSDCILPKWAPCHRWTCQGCWCDRPAYDIATQKKMQQQKQQKTLDRWLE